MIQDRNHFHAWLTENGLTGTGVEVGVYYGQYSSEILAGWPGKLVGIDPYVNYPKEIWTDGCNLVNLEEAMAHALKLLEPFGERFKLIRKPSVEAAVEFEDGSLDFVYCDGNHSYKNVTEDMRFWYPKIKSGGVLGGHDFYSRVDAHQNCEVERAVHDFIAGLVVEFSHTPDTSWWIIKP